MKNIAVLEDVSLLIWERFCYFFNNRILWSCILLKWLSQLHFCHLIFYPFPVLLMVRLLWILNENHSSIGNPSAQDREVSEWPVVKCTIFACDSDQCKTSFLCPGWQSTSGRVKTQHRVTESPPAHSSLNMKPPGPLPTVNWDLHHGCPCPLGICRFEQPSNWEWGSNNVPK